MSNIFRELRSRYDTEAKEFTARELSTKINLSPKVISVLENKGNKGHEPTIAELKAYHKEFNVPYEYLMGESNSSTYENQTLSKQLGLSDKAIEVLRYYKDCPYDKALTPTINFLLEQECPNPQDVFYNRDPDEIENEINEWVSSNYVPILNSISNYLTVKLDNDELFDITASGKLEESFNGPGIKLSYDAFTKSVSKNDIIEKVLLLEIEERLKKVKDTKKEDARNGDDTKAGK
jgi:transcriptional regulator with XRE-family HTH domain